MKILGIVCSPLKGGKVAVEEARAVGRNIVKMAKRQAA